MERVGRDLIHLESLNYGVNSIKLKSMIITERCNLTK